ncbi:DUF4421 family protein [Neolewinella persica]|uniref:DUF4421 family protein n=1 Tax=Neolewinella persica TaxID=70998 RepID=UPI00035D378F|nr:DUF4421 family protein [Neolewinella persica]
MHSCFRNLFFCLTFLFSTPLAGQIDTSFIQLFDNDQRINTGLKFRNKSVVFATSAGEEFKLESQGLSFRIGGRYKWASYTFSIPISDLGTGTDEDMGTSFGLGVTLFLRQQLLHASFRNTKGFRSEMQGAGSEFRDDVSLFQATVFGFQVMNPSRFSLRSSFKQRDRQLQSNGSLLLGGLIDRQRMRSENGISIPLNNGNQSVVARYAQTKLGFGLGYGYTWLFKDHWFITPMAIAGPEFRFVAFDELDEDRKREKIHTSMRVRGHLGIGWNGNPLAVAVTAIYLPSLDVTDNLETQTDDLTLELRITRRF